MMGTIVMTGATSGIGRIAAERLIEGGHRVIAGTRGAHPPAGVEERPLDLADLDSVRAFAGSFGGEAIDALVLNAGVQFPTLKHRTRQGFETTFGVNHLAHYLLARLLLPSITEGGRLVITASGLHDSAMKTPVPTPRHADAQRLAHPETDTGLEGKSTRDGMRAYSTSKLLNVMTARSIAALPDVKARQIAVHAYDPGFIPETGLKRDANLVVKAAANLLALLPPMKIANRASDGGAALAGLADGSIASDRLYMSLRQARPTWPDSSEMSRDDAACAKLWADSAAMVGLPD